MAKPIAAEMVHDTKQMLEPKLWVDRHADYLYAYALLRLNDEEKARDMVQETFLAALEKVAAFRGQSSERTWLTAILKHKIIDLYRRKKPVMVASHEVLMDDPDKDFFDPELNNWKREHWPAPFGVEEHDPLHNKEFNGVLERCMRRLPSLWLAVFTMKHMNDESTETICAELKITSANYWVIIHRAKVNLRECLQKNWMSI
jgi:RNA polymerase sigma-70 factor (TIGR02943 family)